MKFHFSAFVYDAQQKILTYKSDQVELTRKCHELLNHLLNNPKQLISRDDLIDHVWHGRVVTNNTIDQCILKLRKALNHHQQDDYIETVYGQGIRFLPDVSADVQTTKHPSNERHHNDTNRMQWLLLASVLLVLTAWLLYQPWHESSHETKDIKSPELNVISQSSISQSPATTNWVSRGSASYLNHLLRQYPNILPKNTRRTPVDESGKTALAIDLLNIESDPWTLIVDTQPLSNSDKDHKYLANITLRNSDGLISQTSIHSSHLTELFPQIAGWASQQDGSETNKRELDAQIFSDDEFAIHSFFLAKTAQSSGDSQQALTYLQTATEHDPNFKMAWYEMAIALRKQADPQKALSILNAINSDDPSMAYRVALVKAQCLDTLGEFKAAESTYIDALKYAEITADSGNIATVYISQGILYRKTKQHTKAENALIQASQMVDAESQPQLYGTIMSSYAKLARNMNNPLLAIAKSEAAIAAFQRSGDLRYQMQAKTTLASILRLRNEFSQAEQLVKESLFHAEQLKHRRGISDNRTKLARIYQQTGRFRLAHQQWQQVLSLNSELELYGNNAEAYLWMLKLHLAESNTAQADIDLKMLQQLHLEHPNKSIGEVLTEAKLIMALQLNQVDTAQLLINQLQTNAYEKVKIYQGDLAKIQQKNAAAELHYLEALVVLSDSGRFDQMVRVLNRLNHLYLTFNTDKLADNLQKTWRLKPFIYPVQKYQAQAAAKAGKYIQAISLLEELKLKAGDYWQFQDQQLLENLRQTNN
jgi:DNA-binding winged helix-turn-helix (wHTH) protein/tetratricopeptide (TPR) repeat protein